MSDESERASNGNAVLSAWVEANGDQGDAQTNLTDLLTDLQHYAASQDIDWASVEERARSRFKEEAQQEEAARAAGWHWDPENSEWRKPDENAADGYHYAATAEHALIEEARLADPEQRLSQAEFPDSQELVELDTLLKRTDFLYPWSDDPDARERGRQQVSNAKQVANAFAARSPIHAQLASIAWDQRKPADMFSSFENYVPAADRTVTAADYERFLRDSEATAKIEPTDWKPDPDYLAFQHEQAEIEDERDRIADELRTDYAAQVSEHEGIAAFEAQEREPDFGPPAKYEILYDRPHPTAIADGDVFRPLYQIRALIDIPAHNVKAGDLGGYVENMTNLSQEGQAWIADNAYACSNARVEGAALLKDHAAATAHSRVHGYAVAEGYSYLSGESDLSGNARVRDVSMYDRARLGGGVRVMSERVFSGDEQHMDTGDIPFDFRTATGREKEYFAHLGSALELDPKFSAYFKTLGFESLTDQRAALMELWTGPDRQVGREALIEMARLVGGRFVGGEYQPRDAQSIFNEAVFSTMASAYGGMVEYRHPNMLIQDGEEYRHPVTGQTIHPVILQAVMRTAPDFTTKDLFQPGFIIENDDPDTSLLVPLPGSLTTLPAAYDKWMEAIDHAIHHVQLMTGISKDAPNLHGEPATIAKLMAMPVLWSANHNYQRPGHAYSTRDYSFLVPNRSREEMDNPFHPESPEGRAWEAGDRSAIGDDNEFSGFVTLTICPDLLQSDMPDADRIDIAAAIRQAGTPAPSVSKAREQATAVYGTRSATVVRMIQIDTDYDRNEAKELRAALANHPDKGTNDAQQLRERLFRLEPANQDVPVQVARHYAEMPDGSIEVPCAMQKRHSEGYSFYPGSVTVTNGVITGQSSVQLANAPGQFGSFPDPEYALQAAVRHVDERARREWDIATGMPAKPSPEPQDGKDRGPEPAISF